MNSQVAVILLFTALLLAGMVTCLEIGRRIGKTHQTNGDSPGSGAIDGAVFALFGLLIAFTFSGAAKRFEQRRHLIIEECNAVGTAYQRIDLLPREAQPDVRRSFHAFLDARLDAYRSLPDIDRAVSFINQSKEHQNTLWTRSVAACNPEQNPAATSLVLSSLNSMFDITHSRTEATQSHPPFMIFALLFVLGLSSALLAGCNMANSKKRSWTHILGFTFVITMAVYTTLELEFPRLGLIRVDSSDQLLLDLRDQFQ